jgi:predicted membrane protein
LVSGAGERSGPGRHSAFILSNCVRTRTLECRATKHGFALAVFGGALGCLLLLLKKSVARYVFFASLLGAIMTLIHVRSFVASYVSLILMGNFVQLMVTVFLIWYSKWAERKGLIH